MSGKFLLISLGIIYLWGFFLFFAPNWLIQPVALFIASWQVGYWVFHISNYLTKEFDQNE